jgi:hypothetical protein
MTHRITFRNIYGDIIREAYAVSIQQAWVIRRTRCPAGCRAKIEEI